MAEAKRAALWSPEALDEVRADLGLLRPGCRQAYRRKDIA
jgi:hypothetical protein